MFVILSAWLDLETWVTADEHAVLGLNKAFYFVQDYKAANSRLFGA